MNCHKSEPTRIYQIPYHKRNEFYYCNPGDFRHANNTCADVNRYNDSAFAKPPLKKNDVHWDAMCYRKI